MAFSVIFIALFAIFTRHAATQGIFQSPCEESSNRDFSRINTFPMNSNTEVKWNTNISAYNILLMQENQDSPGSRIGPVVFQKLDNQPEIGAFDWEVQVKAPLDYDFSPIFFFNLYPIGNTFPAFTSCYFNITAPVSSSSSSSVPTSTPTASTSSSASPTAGDSNPSDSDNDNSLSIGLGVGLGVGIPLVIGAIVGALFWRRRSKKAAGINATNGPYEAANTQPPHAYGQEPVKYAYQDQPGAYQQPGHYTQGAQLNELPNTSAPSELPTTPPK